MTTHETLPSLLDDDTPAAEIDHELKSIGTLVASGQTPLMFFGAGYMGRQTLRAMESASATLAAFIDDQLSLVRKTIDGAPILIASDAAVRLHQAVAYVTNPQTGSSFVAVAARLSSAGFSQIIRGSRRFTSPLLSHLGRVETYFYTASPNKVRTAGEEIQQVFRLLADDATRQEFVSQVRARLLQL